MKIRTGFVSNSSASSFCIYGWTSKELEGTIFNEENQDYWPEYKKLVKAVNEIDTELEIIASNTQNNYNVIGIGECGMEVDHGYDGYWEDFKFPEPSMTQGKKLDEIAKKLNLPQPKMYSETWFDG